MSVISIQPPFPNFTGLDGEPLENGYIFIGVANLNPITNPISVFFDPAFTIPVAQPIRTISGYAANAGVIGRLYVSVDYSIQVQNKNGSVVFNAPAAIDGQGPVTSVDVSGGTTGLTTFGGPVTQVGTITLDGTLNLVNGGTGATTASVARTNLGLGTIATQNANNPTFTGDVTTDVAFKVGSNSTLSATSCQIGGLGFGMALGGVGNNNIGIATPFCSIEMRQDNTFITSATDCFKGGSTTAWTLTSDARIKKNVTAYTKGLVELNQIEIKNYEFNGLAGTTDGSKGIGVIADEIEHVLPETVGTNKVKLQPDDEFPVDLKNFNSTELVYLLVNCVKELNAKVDAQAAEIALLKG